jgi:predicted phage tail protein
MLRTVHLYGHLKKQFGPSFRFDVATAGEALRALNVTFPGKFVTALREGSYHVIRGRRHGGMTLYLELVNGFNLGAADLHIIPVAQGGKNNGGAVKAILGVALIGTAIFFSGGTLAAPLSGMSSAVPGMLGSAGLTWGNVAVLGLGLTLAGAAAMLSKADTQSGSDDSSFSLGGPTNTNEQGNPVALIYGGPVIVGSQAISAGFDIENIAEPS